MVFFSIFNNSNNSYLSFLLFLSSKRIRCAGETSSSNWPDLLAHMKANKNRPASTILQIIKIIITFILPISLEPQKYIWKDDISLTSLIAFSDNGH